MCDQCRVCCNMSCVLCCRVCCSMRCVIMSQTVLQHVMHDCVADSVAGCDVCVADSVVGCNVWLCCSMRFVIVLQSVLRHMMHDCVAEWVVYCVAGRVACSRSDIVNRWPQCQLSEWCQLNRLSQRHCQSWWWCGAFVHRVTSPTCSVWEEHNRPPGEMSDWLCCYYFHVNRVPKLPGKSWIFFLKIQGPEKSWKITLVLESPGKISLKVMHFIFIVVQMECCNSVAHSLLHA